MTKPIMQPRDPGRPENGGVHSPFSAIPWGLRIIIVASVVFGLSVMFLTTISNTFRASLYAGIGAGGIVFAICFVIWALYTHGQKEGWTW